MKKRAKKAKKNKKYGVLYYLNHKNLTGEIEHYGYVFKFSRLLITYCMVTAACILAGLLYRLPLYGYAAILAFAVLQTPILIRNYYKSLYEQRRFSDASKYVERMLYYFKAKGKILDALVEAEKVFPDGVMKQSIREAVNHIRETVDRDALKDALAIIEEKYSCRRIKTLHGFMLQIEAGGGKPDLGIKMLLRDRQIWTDSEVLFQRQKRNVKLCGIISEITALAMCLITLYIPIIFRMEQLDISANIMVQCTAVVLIIYFLNTYRKLDASLCTNRLEESGRSPEKIIKMYDSYVTYNVRDSRKRQILPAVITVSGSVLMSVFMGKWITAAAAAAAVIMIMYPDFNKKMTYRILNREIIKEFPSWIVQVALNLQNDSVIMAIAKTYETAPAVLQPAIARFLKGTEEKPESSEPYNSFLSEFNISEVGEVMATFYSVTAGSGADVNREFDEILERSSSMLESAEKTKNEDRIALMKTMSVSKPAMAAGFKLLTDMTVMLMVFFTRALELI